MFKLIKALAVLFISITAISNAHSTTITAGNLSREVGSDFIYDSLNNRTWLGWDTTRNMTYSQAVASTQTGGQYAGFHVANYSDAALFINSALSGGSLCNQNSSYGTFCGNASPIAEGVLGESYVNYNGSYDYDYVMFLSNNGYGQDVGLIENYHTQTFSQLRYYNDWSSFSSANVYNASPSYPIGWLMYKDGAPASQVPEPETVFLLGLGLIGLGVSRKRRI